MNRFWTFFAVFERFWIELKRYAFNTLSGLVTLYLIFLLIFAGAKYAQGFGINLFGESVEGLVVGFLVWTFALSAYSDLSWSIMREAQQGTLEQLYMCPFGFRFVSFAWIVSSFLTTFVFSDTLLFLMMVTTGKYLRLPLGTLLPLAFLTVAPIYGLGFVMAGLALVFKRIQAFFPNSPIRVRVFLLHPSGQLVGENPPLSLGTRLIGKAMTEGQTLQDLPPLDLLVLLGVAAFYVGLGLCERIAKDRGLLAHY